MTMIAHESDMSEAPALLDVRAEPEFQSGHTPGAANVPVENLGARLHELPPRGVTLMVEDVDAGRADAAAVFLRERGFEVAPRAIDPAGARETGPARVRLWRPSPFLERALARLDATLLAHLTALRGRRDVGCDTSVASGGAEPAAPRALDLACGSGRDAVFLALAGFAVEAIDVLPDALARARDLARRSGVEIETIERDVERDPALPAARYDLVAVFHFLSRPLLPTIRNAVKPCGYVVYETFHARTRETGRKPRNPAHLLETGELARAFAGFEVLVAEDAVPFDGRYVSRLLARKTSEESANLVKVSAAAGTKSPNPVEIDA